MKSNYLILLLSLLFVLSSCSGSLFEDISTNNIEPSESELTVKNFEQELSIKLEWEEDQGVDEYILYRDLSPYGSFTNKIYQGTDLFYNDTDVIEKKFYYYKLAKKRESKVFGKSEFVMGIADNMRLDDYEDNNSQGESADFQNMTSANIYYYEDEYGNILEDRDWYCITVKPRTQITVTINNLRDLSNNELYYNIMGEELNEVTSGAEITISNYSYTAVSKYIQISVNESSYIGNTENSTMRFGNYDLVYLQENNLSTQTN